MVWSTSKSEQVAGAGLPVGRQDPAEAQAQVQRQLFAMGTSLEIWVHAETRECALMASELAFRAIQEAEDRLSTWTQESELARLNASPPGVLLPLSPRLMTELEQAQTLWRSTAGCFDPGIGGLVQAWGLREGGRKPPVQTVQELVSLGGLKSLQLGEGAACRLDPRLEIDEGGFGKGAGLDCAVAALKQAGIQQARLNLGGQWMLLNGTEVSTPIAIAHPADRTSIVLELMVGSESVATSGNSERGIVVEGKHMSHILDARTGFPCTNLGSMTVLAKDVRPNDLVVTHKGYLYFTETSKKHALPHHKKKLNGDSI